MIELRVWLWFTWFVVSNWMRGDAILLSNNSHKDVPR